MNNGMMYLTFTRNFEGLFMSCSFFQWLRRVFGPGSWDKTIKNAHWAGSAHFQSVRQGYHEAQAFTAEEAKDIENTAGITLEQHGASFTRHTVGVSEQARIHFGA